MNTKEEYAHYISALAQRAILYEVSTTPKPGLVDRYNSGAHKDMDFFTFMASSAALYRGFYECALQGINTAELEPNKLLVNLRPPGIECEKSMFQATNGINTHKGIVFSLGILSAVVGRLLYKNNTDKLKIEQIIEEVKLVTKDLTKQDFEGVHEKVHLTYGEKLFIEYGFKGIRGEVESGFDTVIHNAIPIIRKYNKKGNESINKLCLDLLLNLMTECEDTNVIIRGGIDNLKYVKNTALQFVKHGGMDQKDALVKLENMNDAFIEKNISPGGSADLLAVTLFLGMVEGIL